MFGLGNSYLLKRAGKVTIGPGPLMWGEQGATYSLLKGRVKRAALVTDQSLAERVRLLASIAAHRWSEGGKITVKPDGGTMSFFVNDEFFKELRSSALCLQPDWPGRGVSLHHRSDLYRGEGQALTARTFGEN